jgi:hypothetical protein
LALPTEPLAVRYDPRGARIVARCADGQVLLIDPAGCSVVRTWLSSPPDSTNQWMLRGGGLSWSPDGQSVVTWGAADIQVWGPDQGKLRYAALKHDADQ